MYGDVEIAKLRQEIADLRALVETRPVPPHARQHEITGEDTVRPTVYNNGTLLARHRALNFSTGLTAVVDNANKRINVAAAGVTDHGELTGLTDDDHPQYLLESVIDAKGDLIIGTADDTAGRLGIGSPGQVLGVSADGLPEWQGGIGGLGEIVAVCGSGPKVLYTLNILAATPTWTEVSGGLVGTRAKQIQLDKSVAGKAFVRVDTAAVYRHSNIFAGGNWTAILNKSIIDTATGLTTDSIVIGSFGKSPVDGILYANVTTYATYSGTANYNHRFWLFHSHDDGATWTAVEYEGGLSVSTRFRYDTGENDLAVGNNVAGKVYCAIESGSFTGRIRVNKSLDGGHAISEILYNDNTWGTENQLVLPPEGNPNDDELWAHFRTNTESGDFPQRTTNGGSSWANWGPKSWTALRFCDPTDSDYMYSFGFSTVGPRTYSYRSTDRGANWSTVEENPYETHSMIEWDALWAKGDGTSRHYIVGHDYANVDTEPRIFTSEDFDTWTSRAGGLPAIGLYGVDVLDATGDGALLYVDDGEVKHLAPESDGEYLTLVSGLPAWGANPVDAHEAEDDPHPQYALDSALHAQAHNLFSADHPDVDAADTPGDGDVLTYDNTAGKWRATPPIGAALTIEESDGTPSVASVSTIKVTNGSLTDNGSGVVTLDFGSAATDGAAIHDNVAGEIAALTEKATPVDTDLLIIEDSADANAKKKVQIGNLPGGAGGAVGTDAIWDAKGDLVVGTGANTAARLAVGTNGRPLRANSGTASGLEWGDNRYWIDHGAPAGLTLSTTSLLTKGAVYEPVSDYTLYAVGMWTDAANTQAYRIRVYELSGTSQVGAALAESGDITPNGVLSEWFWTLTTPLVMQAGHRYVIALSNVTTGATVCRTTTAIYGPDARTGMRGTGTATANATVNNTNPGDGASWTLGGTNPYVASLLIGV
jgi:hypothetical protein